jgi:hypothetical protein
MTTQSAKIVVANYYGQAAKKSYYLGCSTGGRQACVHIRGHIVRELIDGNQAQGSANVPGRL